MQSPSLGKHNSRIIDIRKAIRHAGLTHDGLLPVEGPKLIAEAARSGIEILDVFVRHGVEFSREQYRANTFELDAATFKSIQSTEASQGVIALVRPPHYCLDAILSVAKPLIVVLGRLQDPGNAGTIVRVAESFSATGCLALTGTVSPHNPKMLRASAGSIFRMPHVWNLELDAVWKALQKAGVRLMGTSPSANSTPDEWDWQLPTAVFVGNEGGGLTDEELRQCDGVVRIPQSSKVQSLNSAIAAAIILYEGSRHGRLPV